MKKSNPTLVAGLSLAMIISLVVISLIVTSLGAAPDDSEPEEEPVDSKSRRADLSIAELQKLLGIESWKVELSEDFGDYFTITFEHLIAGERAFIISGGSSIPDSRSFPVTLREVGDTIEVTVILDEGNLPVSVPKEHLIARDPGFAWYALSSLTPKETAEGVRLLRRKIFKVPFKKDGASFDTTDPRAQHVATTTLTIIKAAPEKSE